MWFKRGFDSLFETFLCRYQAIKYRPQVTLTDLGILCIEIRFILFFSRCFNADLQDYLQMWSGFSLYFWDCSDLSLGIPPLGQKSTDLKVRGSVLEEDSRLSWSFNLPWGKFPRGQFLVITSAIPSLLIIAYFWDCSGI